MSKTNTEKMAPETQTPEMANGMKLDVRVRPIAPMGNLLAFANVTIGGCFKIYGFRICSSEKGLYVNMPATQDKGGNWKDVCWPVTAEFRKQLNDALIDGYGQATLMLTGRCISLLRRVVMSWRSLRHLQQSRKNPAVKLLPGSFSGRMTVLILPGLQL